MNDSDTIEALKTKIWCLEQAIKRMEQQIVALKFDSALLTANGTCLSSILEQKEVITQQDFTEEHKRMRKEILELKMED